MRNSVQLGIFILLFLVAVFSNVVAESGRKEIQFEDLPVDVRSAFQGSDYAVWKVEKVEEVFEDEIPEEKKYEITVTDGTNSMSVIFDEAGNFVQ